MKKRDITTAQGRAKLPVRRAPYTQIMGKGQALLLYVGKLQSNWGARTSLGDRVFAPEGDLTYEEARTAVRAILKGEAATGVKVADPKMTEDGCTFGHAWERYVQEFEAGDRTPSALQTIRSHGAILAPIADMRVATTPLSALNEWRVSQIGTMVGGKRPKTVASVAKSISQIKTALHRAGVHGPWEKLKTGSKRSQNRREIVALLDDELIGFISEAYRRDTDFGNLVKALALTGARPRELRMALVSDLKPEGLLIRFGKTVAKTGYRTIPLTPEARLFLRDLVTGRGQSDPLLGDALSDKQGKYMAEVTAKAAGLPGATLYSLRHGFITNAIYAGVPMQSLAVACGTSISMIERTYAHITAEREAKVWGNLVIIDKPKLRAVR